ncbi:MAG: hypothetical protein ACE5G6_09700, partial [Terriglobia bacterium]
EEGTIVIERPGQPTLRLTGVEVVARDISTTEAFPLRVAVSFAPDSRLSLDGRLGPLDLAAPVRTPFQGEVALENFRPAALASLVTVPPELVRLGPLGGKLQVRSGAEEFAVTGRVALLGSDDQGELTLELAATLPPDFSRVQLDETSVDYAGTRASAHGQVALAPAVSFNLALATSEAEVTSLLAIPGRLGYPLPVSLPAAEGRLTSELQLQGTPEAWQATGKASFRNLAVALEGFAEPVKVDLLEITLEPERIRVAPSQITLPPGVTLTVAGTVENYATDPRLTARVTAGELELGSLLALARTFGNDPLGPGQQLSGRVQPDIRLQGPLAEPARLAYEGTLAFRELSLTTPQLPEPVRIQELQLAFDPKRVSADPFTAQVGQQLSVRLSFRLDNYQTKPVLVAQGETEDADLAALLGLVRTLGSDPLPGGQASGRVTATLNVRGTLAEGGPPPRISGRAQLANASLQPAALTEPLAIERATVGFGPDRLELTNLRLAAAGSTL